MKTNKFVSFIFLVDSDGGGNGSLCGKKKKKSRWGGNENDKTFIPGMPTILPATLDPHQQEAYLGKTFFGEYFFFTFYFSRILCMQFFVENII